MSGRKRASLRLFVALYPPVDVARAMLEAMGALDLPRHRVTPMEQVHLTLFFVGDTDERQLEEVCESVRRSASGVGAIRLTPKALITLPEDEPPRLVALRTDSPAGLMELQRRLAHRLSRRPKRGDDRFLPHFTLCRYATAGGEQLRLPIAIPAFVVERVALVESVLRPEGAEHRIVERVGLG